MTIVRLLLAILLAIASVPVFAAEELTPEKRADIEKLIEVTGATAISKQMAGVAASQMVQMIKQARPDIPAKALDAIPGEVESVFFANAKSFWDEMVPLYHKYFTGAEIKEMLRFYASPLGRKTIKVMPSLMAESMALGQRWGQSLGPTIVQRVKARMQREGINL